MGFGKRMAERLEQGQIDTPDEIWVNKDINLIMPRKMAGKLNDTDIRYVRSEILECAELQMKHDERLIRELRNALGENIDHLGEYDYYKMSQLIERADKRLGE